MGPQHSYRNLILSFMVLAVFGFTVALSFAPTRAGLPRLRRIRRP